LIYILLFLAPTAYLELFYVPVHSGRHAEYQILKKELAHAKKRTNLLLGDSTARRFHFWMFKDSAARINRPDDEWLNLGLGGSSIIEWETLARRELNDHPQLSAVVVLAIGGNYLNSYSVVAVPYISYLAGWEEVARFLFTGDLTFRDALKIKAQGVFHSYSDRFEVLSKLFAFDPSLSNWVSRRVFPTRASIAIEAERTRGGNQTRLGSVPDISIGRERNLRYFRSLADLAALRDKKILFVLSPVHSNERASENHQTGKSLFIEACGETKVNCLNLESAFEDLNFESDQTHLKGAHVDRFFEMVEKKLKSLP